MLVGRTSRLKLACRQFCFRSQNRKKRVAQITINAPFAQANTESPTGSVCVNKEHTVQESAWRRTDNQSLTSSVLCTYVVNMPVKAAGWSQSVYSLDTNSSSTLILNLYYNRIGTQGMRSRSQFLPQSNLAPVWAHTQWTSGECVWHRPFQWAVWSSGTWDQS